jgi:hypothetical protein
MGKGVDTIPKGAMMTKAIWYGALGALLFLWLLALVSLDFAAFDIHFFGFFEEERWYAITLNVFLLAAFSTFVFFGRVPRRTKTRSVAVALFLFLTVILGLGLEAVPLALFGSPQWETVQKWAAKHYPEQGWVQEGWRVSRSACGGYCSDVWCWWKIRDIITGGP